MLLLNPNHKRGVLQFGGDPDVWEDVQAPTWGHEEITWDMSFWRNMPFNYVFTYDIISVIDNPVTYVLLTSEGNILLDSETNRTITIDTSASTQRTRETDYDATYRDVS